RLETPKPTGRGPWASDRLRRRRRGRRLRGGGGAELRPAGDDAHQPPVLGLGQGPRLHDLDGVAGVRLVVLVVDVADGAAADVLAVAGVLDQARDLDPARLLHLVAGDDADLDTPFAAFRFLRLLRVVHGLAPLLGRGRRLGRPRAFLHADAQRALALDGLDAG